MKSLLKISEFFSLSFCARVKDFRESVHPRVGRAEWVEWSGMCKEGEAWQKGDL